MHRSKEWCRRRDSNSHSFRHYPLKIACLPISPRRRCTKYRSNGMRTSASNSLKFYPESEGFRQDRTVWRRLLPIDVTWQARRPRPRQAKRAKQARAWRLMLARSQQQLESWPHLSLEHLQREHLPRGDRARCRSMAERDRSRNKPEPTCSKRTAPHTPPWSATESSRCQSHRTSCPKLHCRKRRPCLRPCRAV